MYLNKLKPSENANGETVVGNNVKFERIRRVTGYLVGTLDRFNNGKRAEERDRVKHSFGSFLNASAFQKKEEQND